MLSCCSCFLNSQIWHEKFFKIPLQKFFFIVSELNCEADGCRLGKQRGKQSTVYRVIHFKSEGVTLTAKELLEKYQRYVCKIVAKQQLDLS